MQAIRWGKRSSIAFKQAPLSITVAALESCENVVTRRLRPRCRKTPTQLLAIELTPAFFASSPRSPWNNRHVPHPVPSRLRVLLTAAGAAIGGAVAGWHWRTPAAITLAILTGALLLLALFLPRVYAPVFRVLDGIVQALLQAVTWVLLGIVFALVFIPGRLVLRLRGRDPLDRARTNRKPRPTAWHAPSPTRDPAERFRAQF